MTTTTTTRRPQWLRALAYLMASYGFMLLVWFWAIAVPVAAIVLYFVSLATDISTSGMAYTHHAALWFPFSLAVIVTVVYLPIHVANGMTRRSFTWAALAAVVLVAFINATVSTVALVIERSIYDGLGWQHGAVDQEGELFANGVLGYGLGLLLLFAAGQLSGSLVGIAYYRLGGWVGTVLLPLTLLPIATVGFVGLGSTLQWQPWGWAADLAVGPLLTVAVLIVGAIVFQRLTRDVAISSQES